MEQISFIPLANLMLGFIPVIILIGIMYFWGLKISNSIYANFRMLIQLLLIGYVLTFIFETDEPIIITLVVLFMILMSAWIAMRPLKESGIYPFIVIFLSLALSGLAVLFLISQFIVDLPRWFEPSFVVPIAGMIFANSMNTVSLAGERFFIEKDRGEDYEGSRKIALETALIPQINALFAVGLVSLPGMMTGQILSGIEPLMAARYQIMVMCMIFSTAGLSAVTYMSFKKY
jgi:putative ABC transport system permease protein